MEETTTEEESTNDYAESAKKADFSTEPVEKSVEKDVLSPENRIKSAWETLRQFKVREKYDTLKRGMEEAKKIDGFSPKTAISSGDFRRLILGGLSPTEAWTLMHFDALTEKIRTEAREECYREMSEKLKFRPTENGIDGCETNLPSPVRTLSDGGIKKILSRVEKGARIKF